MNSRPVRTQAILSVISKEQLSPNLVRLVLGGPGIKDLNDNEFTDKYVKILIPDPQHGLEPPYDLEGLRDTNPEALPARRTYTVRWIDQDAQQLAIDFVTHGEEGAAGPWAATAEPGDVLAMFGAGGGYRPDPEADFHLLVGDLSAVPAIASALEVMPADARGVALIQSADPEDQLALTHPEGVELRWIEAPDGSDALLQAVAAVEFAGTVQAFVHGERGAVKALRKHFTDERELSREQLSISAYWALGRVEDAFQAEKREPIGQI